MNCPSCDKSIKPLIQKPHLNTITTTSTVDFGITGADGFAVASSTNIETKSVFKCCNPECWVTRVEVDWGQS